MCGRYTLLADEMKIRQRFMLEQAIADYEMSYNIAPGQNVLAIIHDGEKRRAGYLRWGLVPFWAKDVKIGYKMMNARSETIHEKPSFKHLLLRKHCLIIADSFYEWQKTPEGKIPQRIQTENRGLFAFAGLWDKWEHDGVPLFTCTMLTKDANEFMRPIHHRMPIILREKDEDIWVRAPFQTVSETQHFIRGLESVDLTAYPVSKHVNHAKNNDATCIEPMNG
jgi:putative SOS response-associated peptidase YedK